MIVDSERVASEEKFGERGRNHEIAMRKAGNGEAGPMPNSGRAESATGCDLIGDNSPSRNFRPNPPQPAQNSRFLAGFGALRLGHG